jgi:hypothetical protein
MRTPASILGRGVNKACGLRFALQQEDVQFSLLNSSLSSLPSGSSPDLRNMFYHVAKRTFAGAIADESFIIFKFDVIAVDIDGRQTMGAVRSD